MEIYIQNEEEVEEKEANEILNSRRAILSPASSLNPCAAYFPTWRLAGSVA